MDYGASGDGTTDDTAAILAAIADCPAEAAVLLPAGSYYTTETLLLTKSIVLRGEGPSVTHIVHDHRGNAIRMESGGDWAGVEDLHIDTIYPFSDYSGEKVAFDGVQNSWIRNIETSGYIGETIRLMGSSHCEVRDSYIHNSEAETLSVDPFRSYGIEIFGEGASHNLVENNVLDWFRHAMILQYLSTDNVYAYNFAWNNWTSDGGVSATTDMEFHHYNYDTNSEFVSFTLVEGNVFEQGASNSHENNTILRNRINNGGFSVRNNNNLIGNEFVTKKNPGTWLGNFPTNVDEGSIAHGNYVAEDSGVQWDSSINDHDIPNSYYRSSRPSWFGDLDWPPYGGDLMPGNTQRNPAEVRYWTMLFPEESPSNLQADVSNGEVVLTWDSNSTNEVDFVICRSADNADFHRVGYTEETSYTDTVAEPGRYRYYVRARNHLGGRNYQGDLNGIDLGGESDPSGVVTVDTE